MQFIVVDRLRDLPASYDGAYLVPDGWNDYGYVTMFELGLKGPQKGARSLGGVRIAHVDMAVGPESFRATLQQLPRRFSSLGEEFFSLGVRDSYYEEINELRAETRDAILRGLRDVAYDYSVEMLERVRHLSVFRESLLRDVRHRDAELERLHLIARGRRRVVAFHWGYTPPSPPASDHVPSRLGFYARPGSLPPTNVHALIGRNGVGKTTMMREMAHGVASGTIKVTQHAARKAQVTPNVVVVSFSAFDEMLDEPEELPRLTTIGLRDSGDPLRLKTGAELSMEFVDSLATARIGARRTRWERMVRTLRYPESGFLEDYRGDLDGLLSEGSDRRFRRLATELFDPLSSGHKIVLLTLTRLVREVTERTVVFFDEPEAHLQPPLLSAFVRALSDFLSDVNGMAVVATHSPVVLQEVPTSCVYKLRRYGDVLIAERPELETYGENVSQLTHEAFGLEATATGFYAALAQQAQDGRSYPEILHEFGALGSEARGLLRLLIRHRGAASS